MTTHWMSSCFKRSRDTMFFWDSLPRILNNSRKVLRVLSLFLQTLKKSSMLWMQTWFQKLGMVLISQWSHFLTGLRILSKDMSSSTLGLWRVSHIISGSVLSLTQLDSLLLFFRDSPEKHRELQSISLNSISFQYQRKLMKSMNIQKTVPLFQDSTSKVVNGILRSFACVRPKWWNLLAQCQSCISSQSRRELSHHRTSTSAQLTTTQLDRELHTWTHSCFMLILNAETTQLNSGLSVELLYLCL